MHVRGALSRPCTLVSRVFGRFLRYIESCAHEGTASSVRYVENYVMWNYGIQNKFSVKRMRVRRGI